MVDILVQGSYVDETCKFTFRNILKGKLAGYVVLKVLNKKNLMDRFISKKDRSPKIFIVFAYMVYKDILCRRSLI